LTIDFTIDLTMELREHWNLNPEIDFLNHGSFGATPRVVMEDRCRWLAALESDPIEFLGPERDLEPKLDRVRHRVADEVNAAPECIGFVRNATDGVNAVLRSLPLRAGDEIVVTDHGYNACCNAAHYAAERFAAAVRTARIPFPIASEDEVVEAIEREFTPRTRLLLVDHVTSPTALVFPITRIIESAKRRGIRVLVDGAHAPGMVPVDVRQLQPDYYTANHHKWWCAPKASGFLYVAEAYLDEVRPTVISHGANRPRPGRSRFLSEFDWVGTFDPTPILSVPAAIEFLKSLQPGGLDERMRRNRSLALRAQQTLAEGLELRPSAPDSMIGSMVSVPIPRRIADRLGGGERLQQHLFRKHRIEVPVFPAVASCADRGDGWLLRVSLQAYNSIDQIERLVGCVAGTSVLPK
jgi:isopenicillin-N epimerase